MLEWSLFLKSMSHALKSRACPAVPGRRDKDERVRNKGPYENIEGKTKRKHQINFLQNLRGVVLGQ